MPSRDKTIDVYVEKGSKRVFASALDWPGWSRSAKTERDALDALVGYGTRYAAAVRTRKLGFTAPKDGSALTVVQRISGNASTDFGVPGKIPKSDEGPVDRAEMKRLRSLLEASWAAFDRAVGAARGKKLATGPRGGGRDLGRIVQHVLEADGGYLGAIGVKHRIDEKTDRDGQMATIRTVILKSLDELVGVEPVRKGPRGGKRWPPRYYVRRMAWHVLDHAWEIEDRIAR